MQEIIFTESQYSPFLEPVHFFVDEVPSEVDPLPIEEMSDFNIDLSNQVNCAVTFFMEHEGYTREEALTLVENFLDRGIDRYR
jgi:hypothetical protein